MNNEANLKQELAAAEAAQNLLDGEFLTLKQRLDAATATRNDAEWERLRQERSGLGAKYALAVRRVSDARAKLAGGGAVIDW